MAIAGAVSVFGWALISGLPMDSRIDLSASTGMKIFNGFEPSHKSVAA